MEHVLYFLAGSLTIATTLAILLGVMSLVVYLKDLYGKHHPRTRRISLETSDKIHDTLLAVCIIVGLSAFAYALGLSILTA